jgi:hypothetical protein
MTVIGNVMRGGQSTVDKIALVMVGGSGDLALFEKDNIAVDRIGNPLPMRGSYTNAPIRILKLAPQPIFGVTPLPASQVQDYVIKNAGAFNWSRDHEDGRVVADTIEGRGYIINSQSEWGGYPRDGATTQPFDPAKWDLDTMTRK